MVPALCLLTPVWTGLRLGLPRLMAALPWGALSMSPWLPGLSFCLSYTRAITTAYVTSGTLSPPCLSEVPTWPEQVETMRQILGW